MLRQGSMVRLYRSVEAGRQEGRKKRDRERKRTVTISKELLYP